MISEKAFEVVQQSRVLSLTDKIVVAVSGGCDSVALLHILGSFQERLGIGLHVASLDHGLRGAKGQRDVEFVRNMAARLQLPFTSGRVSVPELAQQWGVGLEAAARRARYDFLADVARQEASRCVAVGHHAHDQAETILMHIIRGSGTRGLSGMRTLSPMPCHPEILLLRPLLAHGRDELEVYCSAQSLSFRIDESNDDKRFNRNFLRHEVLSRISHVNPNYLGAFGRLADAAAADEELLAELVEAKISSAVDKHDGAWRIGKSEITELHPALQRRLLREVFQRLADDSSSLSHKRTLDLVSWLKHARTGAKRDAGASIELLIDYDSLWFLRKGQQPPTAGYRLIPADTDLVITPLSPFRQHGLAVSIESSAPKSDVRQRLVLRAGCRVRLRTRRPGDCLRPKGMGGQSRKLKDWMIDRKVPRYLRERIPLVAADGDIVAICLGQRWYLAESSPLENSEQSLIILNLE